MKLKDLLVEKYGSLNKAAQALKYNQSDLHKLVSKENLKPRIDTVQRVCVNGISVTVKNGRVVWSLENTK